MLFIIIRLLCFICFYRFAPLPWKEFGFRKEIHYYLLNSFPDDIANAIMNVIWITVLVIGLLFEAYAKKEKTSTNPFDSFIKYDPVEHVGELGPKDDDTIQ